MAINDYIKHRYKSSDVFEFECPWCGEHFERDKKYINKAKSRNCKSFCCSLTCSRCFQNVGWDVEKAKKLRDPEYIKMIVESYRSKTKSIYDLEKEMGIGKKMIRRILSKYFEDETIYNTGNRVKNIKNSISNTQVPPQRIKTTVIRSLAKIEGMFTFHDIISHAEITINKGSIMHTITELQRSGFIKFTNTYRDRARLYVKQDIREVNKPL